jgi:hypothetical protein
VVWVWILVWVRSVVWVWEGIDGFWSGLGVCVWEWVGSVGFGGLGVWVCVGGVLSSFLFVFFF